MEFQVCKDGQWAAPIEINSLEELLDFVRKHRPVIVSVDVDDDEFELEIDYDFGE